MKIFDPDQFLLMGIIHGAWRGNVYSKGDEVKLDHQEKANWLHDFECAETLCKSLGLTFSEMTIQRIKSELSGDSIISSMEILNSIEELENRLTDEMKSRKFFSVEPDKQYLLDGENLFGVEVAKAFHSASNDIEEAGKCLAFERWTAAVFHLSRIAEIATVQIGKKVGYKSPKEGFSEVLKYMDNQLERVRKDYKNASPSFKGNVDFLSNVTAQMHVVNQAWRQRVAHLDKKYTEEEALRIWSATKGLMEQLAIQISEGN